MNRRKKKKNTMTLGQIGFAMKFEASRTEGDSILVSKELWLEIAQLLMDTGSNLGMIRKELEELERNGGGVNEQRSVE